MIQSFYKTPTNQRNTYFNDRYEVKFLAEMLSKIYPFFPTFFKVKKISTIIKY